MRLQACREIVDQLIFDRHRGCGLIRRVGDRDNKQGAHYHQIKQTL